jgi:hypothetical protein
MPQLGCPALRQTVTAPRTAQNGDLAIRDQHSDTVPSTTDLLG